MASKFNVEVSMREPPSEAIARAASSLDDSARVVGMRLTKRGPDELGYRPRVQFPFVIMLVHILNGEQMTVKFEPGEGGGSKVTISGAVANSKRSIATDPDHWSEALGGSTPAPV